MHLYFRFYSAALICALPDTSLSFQVVQVTANKLESCENLVLVLSMLGAKRVDRISGGAGQQVRLQENHPSITRQYQGQCTVRKKEWLLPYHWLGSVAAESFCTPCAICVAYGSDSTQVDYVLAPYFLLCTNCSKSVIMVVRTLAIDSS